MQQNIGLIVECSLVKHSRPAVAHLFKDQNCACKNRSCMPYSASFLLWVSPRFVPTLINCSPMLMYQSPNLAHILSVYIYKKNHWQPGLHSKPCWGSSLRSPTNDASPDPSQTPMACACGARPHDLCLQCLSRIAASKIIMVT